MSSGGDPGIRPVESKKEETNQSVLQRVESPMGSFYDLPAMSVRELG